MEDVSLMAAQGHDSLILSETVHADGAVKALSEEEPSERHPLESAIVSSRSQPSPIEPRQANEADQANREIDSECCQCKHAKQPECVQRLRVSSRCCLLRRQVLVQRVAFDYVVVEGNEDASEDSDHYEDDDG